MESQTTTAPPAGRGKDKMVAGLLGILLGGLGVHQFYLGSNTTGIIEIVLSIVSCYILGSICGIVEGIMILTMSQEDFDARYNRRTPANVEFVFMKPSS